MLKICKINISWAFSVFALVWMVRSSIANPPNDWKKHLNNVTPYRVVANTDTSPPTFNGCRATRFWGMFRHGTRNPNEKYFNLGKDVLLPLRDEIVANQKGTLSKSDIALFKNWKIEIDSKDVHMLTEEGARELRQLGERFKIRFPDLFSNGYDPTTFEFYHTSAVRTKDSASNFTVGIFGQQSLFEVRFADQTLSNSILKFYKGCTRYIKEVRESRNLKKEYKLFLETDAIKTMERNVNRVLGTSESVNFETILVIYTWCSFESAWSDVNPSPWCKAFSKQDLQVLEYIRDLKHYAKHGYWAEITGQMMCPMVKSIFDFFSSGRSKPSVKFHFAHSNTILKLYRSLGLFEDPHHLKASNFASNLNRQWNGSGIDSFAANIVFVLYECGNTKKVLTLFNEKPITLPGCPRNTQCPLKTVLQLYSDAINLCDYNAICKSVGD